LSLLSQPIGLWKSGQLRACCPLFHRLYDYGGIFLLLFFPPLTLLLIGSLLLQNDFTLNFSPHDTKSKNTPDFQFFLDFINSLRSFFAVFVFFRFLNALFD